MFTLQPTNLNPAMIMSSPESGNNIILYTGSEEMLKITQDGFYVRGVRVPADHTEAQTVYNSFKQWMAWASLTQRT
jgi:hypothetical protein